MPSVSDTYPSKSSHRTPNPKVLARPCAFNRPSGHAARTRHQVVGVPERGVPCAEDRERPDESDQDAHKRGPMGRNPGEPETAPASCERFEPGETHY